MRLKAPLPIYIYRGITGIDFDESMLLTNVKTSTYTDLTVLNDKSYTYYVKALEPTETPVSIGQAQP